MLNREIVPASGKLDSFLLPKMFFFTADNGLKVSAVNKPKLPIVQLDFIIFSGSNSDPENKYGLANLTSMVIDEGAGEYSSLQLAEEFEKLGSFFSIETHVEFIKLSLFTLKENVDRSFELISKIIQFPQFNESDFQREKNKATTSLLRLSDESQYLADAAFDKVLYANSYLQFPKFGTLASLNNITITDCKNYYKQNFFIQNMHLIATGDIDSSEIKGLVGKYLNNINSSDEKVTHNQNLRNNKSSFFVIDKEDSVQSEIRIGRLSTPRNEGNHFARSIMNTILGGSFVSRININLREEKGFTYGAHSSFFYYQNASNFVVSTAVETKNTIQTIKEIFKEFESIRLSISKEEIDIAKSYLIKLFPSMFESYEQINNNVFNLIYFALPGDYYDNYIKNIESVSVDEVQSAASDEIIINDMQVIIAGDKKNLIDSFSSITKDKVNIIEKEELIEKC